MALVSAIQIDGQRLHELARRGIEVDRPARAITVTSFSLSATSTTIATLILSEIEQLAKEGLWKIDMTA